LPCACPDALLFLQRFGYEWSSDDSLNILRSEPLEPGPLTDGVFERANVPEETDDSDEFLLDDDEYGDMSNLEFLLDDNEDVWREVVKSVKEGGKNGGTKGAKGKKLRGRRKGEKKSGGKQRDGSWPGAPMPFDALYTIDNPFSVEAEGPPQNLAGASRHGRRVQEVLETTSRKLELVRPHL
jgi:hypothetical protein